MKGPTERTLKLMRDRGFRADVVEKWVPHTNKRKDLFDIIDIVAIGWGRTIGVQCTSYDGISARVKKIEESEAISDLREAGWEILVVGWRSVMRGKQKRWVQKEVDLS